MWSLIWAKLRYLTYYDQYRGKPLADLDVYTFIAQNIMDVHGSDVFNAGYCTGWIEATSGRQKGAELR
jgi:hypothetical protein